MKLDDETNLVGNGVDVLQDNFLDRRCILLLKKLLVHPGHSIPHSSVVQQAEGRRRDATMPLPIPLDGGYDIRAKYPAIEL